MRIRSIKPEFWRSSDTAALPVFTRLLFIGLWNYVDDNGVGEADENLIRSDLFPREDVSEVSSKIRRGLDDLSIGGQIVRYQAANGRRYLHVVNWTEHQKIDRPTKSKKPLPTSDEVVLVEDSSKIRREVGEGSLPDLGNEGARERGNEGPPRGPELETCSAVVPMRQTGTERVLAKYSKLSQPARHIAKAFSDSLPAPIQSDVLGEMATQIDKCLTDGIPPEAIAAGIREWAASDSWSPTQITRFVAKATAKAGNNNGHGKATRKAMDYDAAAEALIAELETPA